MSTTNLSHTDAAQALIEKIRALRQEVPNLVAPSEKGATRRLASAGRVPPQFVEASASAVKNTPVLALAGAEDPAAVSDLVAYGEAYTLVAAEVEAFGRTLRHSVALAKNKAGRYALNTYALSQRLAAQPENAEALLPVVHALRQTLNRKAKKSDTQPAPAASPAEPTT